MRATKDVRIAGTGEVAGSATAAAFPALKCSWVKFKAASDNAGKVYIGIVSGLTKADGTSDTTTGWPLLAGVETDWLPAPGNTMAGFYRICDNAGDDTLYIATI